MNKLIISIVVAITAIFAASQPLCAAEMELFTRPVPPDTMMALQPRCDFIVTRFWDRCNFEQAFLHPEKLNAAFGEWVMIMPHASAEAFNSKVKIFRSQMRGVRDRNFFIFRLVKLYA